jgi:hypothetical protein
MCLGIGLVLRDLNTIQFDLGEGDDADDVEEPLQHLKTSKLTWGHSKAILGACRDIMDDIAICFQEEEEPQCPAKKPVKANPPKPSPPRWPTTRRSAAEAAKLYVNSYLSIDAFLIAKM